jgi:hypothetical protein
VADFTPPPPPYKREGQHSMEQLLTPVIYVEANTLVRSVYKNAQLVKRIEQAVAFLLEDESGWRDNVFLHRKCALIHIPGPLNNRNSLHPE